MTTKIATSARYQQYTVLVNKSNVIPETCSAIYDVLKDDYLKMRFNLRYLEKLQINYSHINKLLICEYCYYNYNNERKFGMECLIKACLHDLFHYNGHCGGDLRASALVFTQEKQTDHNHFFSRCSYMATGKVT